MNISGRARTKTGFSPNSSENSSLDQADLLFDEESDAVLGQMHLGGGNAQHPGDLFRRPLLSDVAVVKLELFWRHPAADAIGGRFDQPFLPLLIPDGIEVQAGRIRDPLNYGGARTWIGVGDDARLLALSAAMAVDDA